ncbi:MAG TPA: UDP-N-acetylglucosamine 2-epimerase [Jatrophihabitans sp.]|nr:UDP-N-acetylglucosamine 2-epimerase [Jatrophihabitans sp.]
MTAPVAVFAAGRGELFPLAPVLRELAAAADLAPVLLASGVTADRAYGDPLADLDLAGVLVDHLAAGRTGVDVQDGPQIAASVAAAVERHRPAAAVVLGDRWELLYAVPPLLLAGVPIVHLHGGEVTEGAVDERIRHAVTKLADLHCVSTEESAARVRQLGEPADRVVVTGAPGLDRLRDVRPAGDDRLAELLGAPLRRPFALVTYHPPTAGDADPGAGAAAVLAAVAETTASALVTHPGADRGRDAVMRSIAAAVAGHPQLRDVPLLGADYLPVLAAADVVVGNSSSGIIEAAGFGVPVVDVGDRQRGRLRGANVVAAVEDRAAIAAAIRRCLEPAFRAQARQVTNPYGDGHAARRIVDVVRGAAASRPAAKAFVDLHPVPAP